ncbi:LysR family transcriptional regulator [Roseivivax sp. GX 12232]|uniref:LysR family transcriptional regulator n=1 Tax=Roseivivax sp. GX 12232 TaxID=2900547 RepID=UPI001E5EF7A0|nr:LysR family transcriptional regulator [Roseivivax sp. GX 12232]MCE0505536.1 LysR family transcriptional regulator [Roseivivax sp. GX 12232]
MNFASFDLNLLRVLDALLETASTTAAGRRIGLSQPAVSAALSRLRHALDDPLFLRQGRRLVPTDYAEGLRAPLRALLEETERLLIPPAGFDPARAEASFKISGSDFFAEMLMPELADHIARQAPGVRVQLVDLVPESYIDTFDRYQVDLALIPEIAFPDWIAHQHLFRSDFVTIARQGHARLARAGIAPGEVLPIDLFCDLPHVLFSPEGNLRAMGDAALAEVGRSRRVAMTMPVFSGVYTAVARSEMIALIPAQLARRVAPRVGLEIYRPPMPIAPARISMIWHRRATLSPPHQWLRDQIAGLMAPLDPGAELGPKAGEGPPQA